MKKPAIIVIPVHRKHIFPNEIKSLVQCAEILEKHDFCFVCPEDLNIDEYKNILNKAEVKRFPNEYFKSVEKYSELCLKSSFYRVFSEYEYMLLYQLDGWVFKDELEYWCNKGFDYIGAPLFDKYGFSDENSEFIEFSGNGGVSLRRVPSFIKALEYEENKLKTGISKVFGTKFERLKRSLNEDMVITEYLRKTAHLKVPSVKEAMYFSFEALPKRLYALTNYVLPFVCHGFEKYDRKFWKNFIDIDDTPLHGVGLEKPVLLLVFNRLDTLKEVFNEIKIAKPKRLYIASDGPREEKDGEEEKVLEVRDYLLKNIDWDCEVKTKFNEKNLGCQKAISEAVTWFFNNEEDGIILEDDCVPTQSFFRFCAYMLDYYRDCPEIWHIGGYNYLDLTKLKESYYFSTIPHIWGWATWANRWKNFDFNLDGYNERLLKRLSSNANFVAYWIMILRLVKEGVINSWAYRWTFSVIRGRGLAVVPKYNMVKNIGNFGVHFSGKDDCLNTETFDSPDFPGDDGKNVVHPLKVKAKQRIMDEMFLKWYKISNKFLKNMLYAGNKRAVVLFRRFIYKLK